MRRLKRIGGFLLLISLGLSIISAPVSARNPWGDDPPGGDKTIAPRNNIVDSPAPPTGNNGSMTGRFDLVLDISYLMAELMYQQDEACKSDPGLSDRQVSETPEVK
jgi:hypothetical protein